MKGIILAVSLTTLFGCASAEQRIASKQGYRNAQVEAIRVQSDARVSRDQVQALEKQAMWQALAEVVKANPEAASNVAIVAAVAAANDGGGAQTQESGMALIKTERDVTALDWAKVLVPTSVNALTNVGIAALNNRTTRARIRADAAVDLAEIEVGGRVYDVLGDAVGRETTSYTITDDATFVGGDQTVTDDDIYVIGTSVSDADDAVDSVFEETNSFGIPDPDDSGDDPDPIPEPEPEPEPEPGPEPVDCSEPQFSPAPPECQT